MDGKPGITDSWSAWGTHSGPACRSRSTQSSSAWWISTTHCEANSILDPSAIFFAPRRLRPCNVFFGIGMWSVSRKHGLSPRSEEHTSELQSLMRISYAVFCLKKKIKQKTIMKHITNKAKQNYKHSL